ncbi:hypothetical protein OS493_030493 [Desmophyllum pertusum]|uniref:Uncharacterized protein n=1 Tax=Desmophyllum pertusum TaxID=174260 RepID=A0A9X0CK13_9CNID|nr:hypothetical protein OS493_030493 [Desmophyllum pertusum]
MEIPALKKVCEMVMKIRRGQLQTDRKAANIIPARAPEGDLQLDSDVISEKATPMKVAISDAEFIYTVTLRTNELASHPKKENDHKDEGGGLSTGSSEVHPDVQACE